MKNTKLQIGGTVVICTAALLGAAMFLPLRWVVLVAAVVNIAVVLSCSYTIVKQVQRSKTQLANSQRQSAQELRIEAARTDAATRATTQQSAELLDEIRRSVIRTHEAIAAVSRAQVSERSKVATAMTHVLRGIQGLDSPMRPSGNPQGQHDV